jgi:hypothetical protein
MTEYPVEVLSDDDDDGTMPGNVAALSEAVIGHRIVSAARKTILSSWHGNAEALVITLDNGKKVSLEDTNDCCAFTELESFLLNADKIDHVITGVGTTDGYTKWHVFADLGDVLELNIGWSSGTPFYHGYGFDIAVTE